MATPMRMTDRRKTRFEIDAFVSADGITTVPTTPQNYVGIEPNYTFQTPPSLANHGRQLLARHLYVLMMALTRDLDSLTTSGTAVSW